MTPTAAHIQAAMKIDRYLAREVDCSMALMDGWIAVGRWRAMPDEELTDDMPDEGFWVCFAQELDGEEADATISIVADPRQIYKALMAIYPAVEHLRDTTDYCLTQLMFSLNRMINVPQYVGRCSMHYDSDGKHTVLTGTQQCYECHRDKFEDIDGEEE